MTKYEIMGLSEFMQMREFASQEEIINKIHQMSFDRNHVYDRFYLFDLVKANVIYKYDEERYRFVGKLRHFEYDFTDTDMAIKSKLENRFDSIQLCVWNTSFLSRFVNLLPYDYYTFVECDKEYMNLVYDCLKSDYRILFHPNQKELDLYTSKINQVILKKMVSRAPLNKKYDNHIGINSGIPSMKKVVLTPKIEKILVDVFVESSLFSVFSDLQEIYEGIIMNYCINYQKLFYYAKNRGIDGQIKQFIHNDIRYDILLGAFR